MNWYYKMLIGFLVGILSTVIVMLLLRSEPETITDDTYTVKLEQEIQRRDERIDSLRVVIQDLADQYKQLQTMQDKIIYEYESKVDSVTYFSDDESVEHFLRRTSDNTH